MFYSSFSEICFCENGPLSNCVLPWRHLALLSRWDVRGTRRANSELPSRGSRWVSLSCDRWPVCYRWPVRRGDRLGARCTERPQCLVFHLPSVRQIFQIPLGVNRSAEKWEATVCSLRRTKTSSVLLFWNFLCFGFSLESKKINVCSVLYFFRW